MRRGASSIDLGEAKLDLDLNGSDDDFGYPYHHDLQLNCGRTNYHDDIRLFDEDCSGRRPYLGSMVGFGAFNP
jgi:hypothetical protein